MRGLSGKFIKELKSGLLNPILSLVQKDSTLCLEIRENYINVYYRGGNLLRIEQKNDSCTVHFEKKYIREDFGKLPSSQLTAYNNVEAWIAIIPFLKNEMDLWFGRHPKNEREFQQLMVRENNFGNSAKSTDYFICDIEYTQPNTNWRFDLVAINWPSTPSARKNNKNLRLSFIEMKYLDHALTEKNTGINKHIRDMNGFLELPSNLLNIKNEMKTLFNQKLELGLIDNKKPIESFGDQKPEYIFVFANHDPESNILKREMKKLLDCPNAELKFGVSTFMGYGLYGQNIYSQNSFLERFENQI